jgi:hypothetical protein
MPKEFASCFREELTDAALISQTLWASVHGVISLHIAKGGDCWVDWHPLRDRAEMMLDITLRGLIREKSPLLPKSGRSGAPGAELEGK